MRHRLQVRKLELNLQRPWVAKCSCNLGMAAPSHQEILEAALDHLTRIAN